MRNYLFNTEKIKYILADKTNTECILCSIRDGNEDVKNLNLYYTELSIVTMNLYPFNAGHLMVFPKRHVESFEHLTDIEAADIHKCTKTSIEIINSEFTPHGFNIGYNIGEGSGASIKHLHLHIVPRYKNEAGFIEVLGGVKIAVVDPLEVHERLVKRFSQLS